MRHTSKSYGASMFLIGLGSLNRLFIALCGALALSAQTASDPSSTATAGSSSNVVSKAVNDKRIFGIIPNYRTAVLPNPYKALSAKEKFKIATQDAFDRGTFVLAAAFAGEAQLTNANRAFGQGAAGYGQYLGTSYADFVIGDYMTEGIFPSLLHQDPRYFRNGNGGVASRLLYAAGQIFITHGDNGNIQPNFSELAGNAAAVAISNAYYVNNRDAADAASKWGTQLGVDMASNMLKEFWPDITRKLYHKHQ